MVAAATTAVKIGQPVSGHPEVHRHGAALEQHPGGRGGAGGLRPASDTGMRRAVMADLLANPHHLGGIDTPWGMFAV
jgi:hypothetical protein